MGMYDELVCRHPLPGSPPAWVTPDTRFLTKSLDNAFALYEITADGRFDQLGGRDAAIDPNARLPRVRLVPHCDVVFHTDNARSCVRGPEPVWYTASGEDYEYVEYAARFSAGSLSSITETARERHPAKPIAEMPGPWPTAEEQARVKARFMESLVGKTVYYRPLVPFTAETEPPVPVEVVAECKRHWCVRLPDGSLELVFRGLRDRRLFTEPPARVAEPVAG